MSHPIEGSPARDKFLDVLHSRRMLRTGEEWVIDVNLRSYAAEVTERAEAAIERVRAIKNAPSRSFHNTLTNAQDDGWDAALSAVHAALDTEPEASSPNTLHAELEQAQAAIARVRRLSEATIEYSVRVDARHQALDTLAALDNVHSAAETMQAAGSPVMTGFTNGIGWKAADHIGHGSPCEETASGSCARPDTSALREQLGAAIASAPSQELRQDGTGPLRITAYVPDLVSAVLAVIKPHARTYAGLARSADADVQRVIALYESWVKAGPPPLGTSLSRWWDTRLLELCAVINGASPENPS